MLQRDGGYDLVWPNLPQLNKKYDDSSYLNMNPKISQMLSLKYRNHSWMDLFIYFYLLLFDFDY